MTRRPHAVHFNAPPRRNRSLNTRHDTHHRRQQRPDQAALLKKSELSTNKGKIQAELAHLEKQIKAVADQQDTNQEKVDQCESALRRVGAIWTDLDVDARLEYADNEAKTLNVNTAKNAHE